MKSSRDIILRTRRWAEAVHFYEKVIGCPVTFRSETMIGFETGSFCLYVERGKDHGPVMEFLSVDVEAKKKELLAAGCEVVEEDASVPRCYLRDPFGLVFNIGEGGS